MGKTALITGASTGIGRELALIHAAHGGDLVVVARSQDKLEALKKEIESKYQSTVHVFAKDLSAPVAARELYEAVIRAEIEVDYLINNAGYGGHGLFHERDWADDLGMINLNIIALTGLTRFFLSDFVFRGSGRVLNLSSTASLLPGPMQAVYFATKAYVTSFSNAIAEELRGTGVTVTALLPGATETDFAKTAGLQETKLFQKTFSAKEVAKDGYDAMLKGKIQIIAGVTFGQRMMLASSAIAPKSMLLKQVKQMQSIKQES